jgi:hypothetical protein
MIEVVRIEYKFRNKIFQLTKFIEMAFDMVLNIILKT